MPLLLKGIVFYTFIFSVCVFSQNLDKEEFDKLLNSNISFVIKSRKVDSIIRLKNISETNISYVYHCYARFLHKIDKDKESFYYLNKAIILRKKNQKNDLISLKKSLCNLGLYYSRSGSLYKSIDVFKELISLPNEDRLRMKAYSELITLYSRVGDFKKSTNLFLKTTKYYIQNKNHIGLYKNYMRISKVYALMDYFKHSDKIINYLAKADSLGKYTPITKKDQAIINLRLGSVYEDN